jgi:hypothetical protein
MSSPMARCVRLKHVPARRLNPIYDQEAQSRRLSIVFAQEKPADRPAQKSGDVQVAQRRRKTRTSRPVFQASLTHEATATADPLLSRGVTSRWRAIINQFIDTALSRLPAVADSMPESRGTLRELDAFLHDVRTEM